MGMDRHYQGPKVKKMKSNTNKYKVLCLGLFTI